MTLKEEALAKSHRPTALLTNGTCPIVGTLDYGELLLSASPAGLDTLVHRIRTTKGKKTVANITAIESIEPYRLNDWSASKAAATINEWIQTERNLKFHLFDHQDDELNELLRRALSEIAEKFGVALVEKNYGSSVSFYSANLAGQGSEARKELTTFVGLRSVTPMPMYGPTDIGLAFNSVGELGTGTIPEPDSEVDYPVVGVIDSGVCPDCTALAPWIEAVEQYVPTELQDNFHGTMVAGLVANPYNLNQEDSRFPNTQAKVVDVQVFEKNKLLSEDSLVSIIEEVVEKYSHVRVWNLSLGGSEPTDLANFSDFATFLDEIHDRYGCLFVVASGNHEIVKKWPHNGDKSGKDRVSSPGDCIRGLTVGSIANIHKPTSLSKTEEPSPFSRRGPGPCHVPKPEVTHYGGNCNSSLTGVQTGVLCAGPHNKHVESIGTSFSTPLVSSQAAAIWHYLDQNGGECTAEQVKALLIHSALIGDHEVSADTLNHTGFGRPGDVIDALYCDPKLHNVLV